MSRDEENEDDNDMDEPEFWLNTDFPPFPPGFKPTAEDKERLAMWEASTEQSPRGERTYLRHPDPSNRGKTLDMFLHLPLDYYVVDKSSGKEVVVRHKGIIQQEIYRGPGPVELIRRKP
jgi:hypothetical protein